MNEVAPGVWQLEGWPAHAVNVYLADDLLIDAGTRWARRRVLRQLRGRPPRLVALTHCHPDHQGAARAVCRRFGVPLACHEADAAAMEGREPMWPRNRVLRLGKLFLAGPPSRVGRLLRDGDTLGGFRVVHAPGHTPGHVVYFRERDRLAFAGDLLANINFRSGQAGLRLPPPFFSADPARNRASVRLLAALKPAVVLFGHGPPLYRPELLDEFVHKLDSPDEKSRPSLHETGGPG